LKRYSPRKDPSQEFTLDTLQATDNVARQRTLIALFGSLNKVTTYFPNPLTVVKNPHTEASIMKIYSIRLRLAGKLALLILAMTAFSAHAQIIADTFNLNALDGRTAGADLNGLSPTVGSGTYTSDAVFGSTGGLVEPSAGTNFYGDIGFSATGPLSVSASGTTAGAGWLAVGFQTTGSDVNIFDSDSDVFVLLAPGGYYSIYEDGTTNNIFNGQDTTNYLGDNTANTLSLLYDPSSNDVSVYVNGALQTTQALTAALPGTIGGARFYMETPTADSNIASFEVDAAPEPTTSALFIAGGFLTLGAFLRKNRFSKIG
jgi:hypothetical protein